MKIRKRNSQEDGLLCVGKTETYEEKMNGKRHE